MKTPSERFMAAALDYCLHAEALTVLRRNVAGDCPREISSINHYKCHQSTVIDGDHFSGPLPESGWCERCRTFKAQRRDYLSVRASKICAERRMRDAWRAIRKEDE